jgi:hypothetical protein
VRLVILPCAIVATAGLLLWWIGIACRYGPVFASSCLTMAVDGVEDRLENDL